MPDLTGSMSSKSNSRGTRRSALWLAVCVTFFLPAVSGAATVEPQRLLEQSDAIRNPDRPFRVHLTLTEYEKGAQTATTALVSYARITDSGQFASIVRFTSPERDVGKLMLKNGSDLWFYDPSTKATVRISPQQRLLGQAANGDVVTVNFSRDYKAELSASESIKDGDRQARSAHKLRLTASNSDATYGSIELWLDVNTAGPIKARFFADSGRLLKTAYYRRYQRELGVDRPTETVIIDGVEPGSVTIVRMSEFGYRNAPPSWFQRDYLTRFSAE